MLDLSYSVRRLTQGRPLAEMVLAREASEESSQPAVDAQQSGDSPEKRRVEVDPHAVAERVYDLMRRELRDALERGN